MDHPHVWQPYFGLLRRTNGFRKQCICCGLDRTSGEWPDRPEASLDCLFAKLGRERDQLLHSKEAWGAKLNVSRL
jgi:hypothetical protein